MIEIKRPRTTTKYKSFSGFLISILFFITFFLVFFNKTDHFIASKIKDFGIDVVSPVTRVISTPITITKNIRLKLDYFRTIEIQNLRLREEVIRLKKWQTLAIKNSRENKVFKRLLNSTSNEIEVIKTASILSYYSSIYAKTIIINVGIDQNVYEDLSVINDKGLCNTGYDERYTGDPNTLCKWSDIGGECQLTNNSCG